MIEINLLIFLYIYLDIVVLLDQLLKTKQKNIFQFELKFL
jgi:hypothetical protein